MADFGGVIRFRLPSGETLKIRGNIKHKASGMSYEKVVNHDLSVDRTVKPEGYEFEMSLAHEPGRNYDDILALANVNISFIHETENVIRIYKQCCMLGRAEVDAMTGEVTGIGGVAQAYDEV